MVSGTAKQLLCVHQHSDGLQAVAHDVLGLRTAVRLLVQELHAWHRLAAFWCFEAISDQNNPAIEESLLCMSLSISLSILPSLISFSLLLL
jgi:hypothetical protein